jgi:hypothetical protein
MEVRPTETIREVLLYEIMLKLIEKELQSSQSWTRGIFAALQESVSKGLVWLRRQMHRQGVFIMRREWNQWDVCIEYKFKDRVHRVPYMLPMLEAEALARLEHMLDLQ